MSPASPPPAPPVDPRIYLAAERTLLAWIRTGIALMGFGLVVAKLRFFLDEIMLVRGQAIPVSSAASNGSGALLLLFGVLIIVASSVRHQRYLSQLERLGPDTPVPRRFPLVLAGILALLGLGLVVHLLATARELSRLVPQAPPAPVAEEIPR